MVIVKTIFIAVHILSIAAIIGGWLANFKNPTVTPSQWYGAIGMIISGIVLYGLAEMNGIGDPALRIKLTIKLLLGLIVFVTALLKIGRASCRERVSSQVVGEDVMENASDI